MRKRVGVYGGMFDPVHCGHLAVAELAVEALSLDRILLVPCKLPNHRHAASASGPQRLDMLGLACAKKPQLEASPIELEREGVSYSVDTLTQLRAADPDTDFVFVLGRDAFEGLPRWERWERPYQRRRQHGAKEPADPGCAALETASVTTLRSGGRGRVRSGGPAAVMLRRRVLPRLGFVAPDAQPLHSQL